MATMAAGRYDVPFAHSGNSIRGEAGEATGILRAFTGTETRDQYSADRREPDFENEPSQRHYGQSRNRQDQRQASSQAAAASVAPVAVRIADEPVTLRRPIRILLHFEIGRGHESL